MKEISFRMSSVYIFNCVYPFSRYCRFVIKSTEKILILIILINGFVSFFIGIALYFSMQINASHFLEI